MLRDSASSRPRRRLARRRAGLVSLGTVVAFAVVACGDPLPDLEPGQSPAAYSGLAVDEGRIEYAIGKVEDIVSEEMEATGVPGVAVAVVHGGEVTYSEGFGVRSVTTGDEVDSDTVFPLAGASAAVSATVVAAQAGAAAGGDAAADAGTDVDGDAAVDPESIWSTPVREQLPWFELSDPGFSPAVTVGDLFAHRSGLPEGAGDELGQLGHDRPAVLHGLRHIPLAGFRDTFAWTDFGVTAGAEAVAMSAGMSWAELASERILDPLGMDDTSFGAEDLLQHPDRAVGHVPADEGSPGGTGDDPISWTVGPTGDEPDARAPASGLSSSVSDMARWMTMVLGDGAAPGGQQVVPADELREALTPQITAGPPEAAAERTASYGYGFTVSDSSSGRVQWSQSGASLLGASSAMLMLPSLDLGIITLTNAAPVGSAETINSRFADLAQYGDPAIEWREHYRDAALPRFAPVGDLVGQTAPSSPEESRPLDELEGLYESDFVGPVTVRNEDGQLVLDFGRDQDPWTLDHWDGDTFAASPTGEIWPAGSRGSVWFRDGEVTIDLLNRHGLGTLTRVEGDSPTG